MHKLNFFGVVLMVICIAWLSESSTREFIQSLQTSSPEVSNRHAKNFFPFVWVTFRPSPCGMQNEGTCVQRDKCTKLGGRVNGECQDTFGECCYFEDMCNVNKSVVTVNQLVTTLRTPSPYNSTCTFRFRKEQNICQIRLDFLDFQSMNASRDGNCEVDRLKIRNSITVNNGFTTCGNLNGQHMHLSFGAEDTIDVIPSLRSPSSSYRIVATKIPCDSKNRAPDYCLQYYTQQTGRVRSFDFGRQQQNNQDYTICVKPLSQSEEIRWRGCEGEANPFSISAQEVALPGGDVPQSCRGKDWIQVKGKEQMCTGAVFPIISRWKPYEMFVSFNEREFPDPPAGFPSIPPGACPNTPRMCTDASNGFYNCMCMAENGNACQCTPKPDVPPPEVPIPDVDNKGFCMEYSQN